VLVDVNLEALAIALVLHRVDLRGSSQQRRATVPTAENKRNRKRFEVYINKHKKDPPSRPEQLGQLEILSFWC